MSKLKLLNALLIFAVLLFPSLVAAQDDTVKIPDEVKPFVSTGKIPVALESGDLNADKQKDFILVVSEVVPADGPYEEGAGGRTVMILIREAGGGLKLAAKNELAAMCKNCGGVYGDPFAGVSIRGTRFTISNYGGSNSRWSYDYTFGYSRRDRAWQLVRVQESSFHALDPKRTEKTRVYTPPKDFGLISFSEFDPDNFQKKGK